MLSFTEWRTLATRICSDAQLEQRYRLRRGHGQEVVVYSDWEERSWWVPRHPALVLAPGRLPAGAHCVASIPPSFRWPTSRRLDGRRHSCHGRQRHRLVVSRQPHHACVATNHVVELNETSEMNGPAVARKRRDVWTADCYNTIRYKSNHLTRTVVTWV